MPSFLPTWEKGLGDEGSSGSRAYLSPDILAVGNWVLFKSALGEKIFNGAIQLLESDRLAEIVISPSF